MFQIIAEQMTQFIINNLRISPVKITDLLSSIRTDLACSMFRSLIYSLT